MPGTRMRQRTDFCEGLLKGEVRVQQDGPLSIAPIIRPGAGYAYTRRGVLK